jgi:hypothetical protein
VTEDLSAKTGDDPRGGLLGMLLRALTQQGQVLPGPDSAATSSEEYASPPQKLPATSPKSFRLLSRRPVG